MQQQSRYGKPNQVSFAHGAPFGRADNFDGQNASKNNKQRLDPVLVNQPNPCDGMGNMFGRPADISVIQASYGKTKRNIDPQDQF